MTQFKATKVAHFLSLLSEEEMKQFGKWLSSPWCNSNKKLIAFHKMLLPHHPGFESKKLTREKLFGKLYPGKDFDDKWMRNIMAAMVKQVEKFMVHQRLERDGGFNQKFLADELLERGDGKNYMRNSSQLIASIENKAVKSIEDYYSLFQLYNQQYSMPESIKNEGQHKMQLIEADSNLDIFFSLQKWRYRLTKKSREKILKNENYPFSEENYLLQVLSFSELSVFKIYKKIVENYDEEMSLEEYVGLKEEVLKNLGFFPLRDKTIFITYLINSSVRLWVKGNSKMMEEIFDLYQIGFAAGALLEHGRISERKFSNFVIVGNNCAKYIEVEKFVNKYASQLPKGYGKVALHWALAHINFKKGNLKACVEELSLIPSFQGNTFSLQGKGLLLQAYFELSLKDDSYFFPFIDWAHAFEKYLSRKKSIKADFRISLVNFIRFSRKLLFWKTKNANDRGELEGLKRQILQEKNVQARDWLMLMVEKKIEGH